MEAILTSLVALLIVTAFIVVGIRISLYLSLPRAETTHHFTRSMHFAGERLRSVAVHTVRSPRRYHRVLDASHANSRYALHSFMVITFILLLTIVATISVLFGSAH